MSRIVLAPALLLALLLLGACGGSGDTDPEAVPGDQVEGFTGGAFDDLPRVPGSDVLQEPTDQDGATTGTFVVRDLSVEQVIDRLAADLVDDGWTLVQGPLEVGDAVRADLVDEPEMRRLEISAFPATNLEDQSEFQGNAVQYSMVLLDGLEDPGTSTSTSVPSTTAAGS